MFVSPYSHPAFLPNQNKPVGIIIEHIYPAQTGKSTNHTVTITSVQRGVSQKNNYSLIGLPLKGLIITDEIAIKDDTEFSFLLPNSFNIAKGQFVRFYLDVDEESYFILRYNSRWSIDHAPIEPVWPDLVLESEPDLHRSLLTGMEHLYFFDIKLPENRPQNRPLTICIAPGIRLKRPFKSDWVRTNCQLTFFIEERKVSTFSSQPFQKLTPGRHNLLIDLAKYFNTSNNKRDDLHAMNIFMVSVDNKNIAHVLDPFSNASSFYYISENLLRIYSKDEDFFNLKIYFASDPPLKDISLLYDNEVQRFNIVKKIKRVKGLLRDQVILTSKEDVKSFLEEYLNPSIVSSVEAGYGACKRNGQLLEGLHVRLNIPEAYNETKSTIIKIVENVLKRRLSVNMPYFVNTKQK